MRKIIAVLALFPALALAALSSLDTRTTATGNGVTTAFTYVFPVQRNADVAVYLGGVEQLGGYTLLRNADQEANPGGSVTFTTAPAAGMAVRIERATPLLQDSVWSPYSPFRAKSLESALDRNVMQMQEVERTLSDYIAADTAIAAGATSSTPILATGTATPLTLADWTGMVLNVKAFGAVGDGVADDTAAVQACINAAGRGAIDVTDSGQGEGGVCFLPRGVYKVTAGLAWTADGVVLTGEGAAATSIKADVGATVDVITLGDGTGAGRRGGVRNLSIFTDTNYGTGKCRDAIYINSSTWWRLENLHIRNAGRHGLKIGGTLHGTAINVRVAYSGDTGVVIERSSGGVEETTSSFYHLYSHDNWKHGVHVRHGLQASFYSPILEYNGKGGVADEGAGFIMGSAGEDNVQVSTLIAPYFEGNKGWDIHTGTGLVANGAHRITVVGYTASAGTSKAAGYGFFYGSRAQGTFEGGNLSNYTVSDGHPETFSLDSTCKISILGHHGNIGHTNRPIYRSGTLDINEYGNGVIQWVDANAAHTWLGRYIPRAGNFGTGAASIGLHSQGAQPTSGTYSRGDVVFNRAPVSAFDTPGWVNTISGTPGSWMMLPPPGGLSGDRGDADVTLTVRNAQPTQRFATTLTANRTVTLSTTGAVDGDRWRVVRTGLGAFTLNVGPGLKTIPASTAAWVDVAYDQPGGAWRLVGYGLINPEPLRATTTVNLGPIGTDACTNTTVTVTGAVTGAECVAGLPAGLPDQLFVTCHVESADTVHAHVCNLGTSYDPPSATYSVRVLNP